MWKSGAKVRSAPRRSRRKVISALRLALTRRSGQSASSWKAAVSPKLSRPLGRDSPSNPLRGDTSTGQRPLTSKKAAEQQHEHQAHRADDRLHQRPGAERVLQAEIEIFLAHPEARIVDVRAHEAAGADGEHH